MWLPEPTLAAGGAWEVSGSHTLRADYYLLQGPRAGSPYRFGGWQPYGELGLQAEGRPGPFRRWRLQMLGALNGSDYRSPRQGAVPERLAALLEDGAGGVPYRVEVGDLYGYLSYRTLQRGLKGVALELQPPGRRQSLLFLVGSGARDWRGLRPLDDLSAGLSYLLETPGLGRWAANLVEHRGEASGAAETALRQRVLSLAGARGWDVLGQRLDLEGELGWFRGDHAGSAAGLLRDRTDRALFLELSGRDRARPVDYRLRLERYGPDYRPAGARVPGGRLAQALSAGWRAADGSVLRLRLERQRQDWRGANPVDIRTGALRAAGPLGGGVAAGVGLHGRAELLQERIRDAGRTRDTRARVLRAGLVRSWSPAWRGRMELYFRDLDDRLGAGDLRVRQLELALRRDGRRGRWRGALEPAVVVRRLRGAVRGWEWEPALRGHAAGGPHRLALALGYLGQDRSGAAIDVATYRLRLDYRFLRGRDELGLEVLRILRDPRPGASSDSSRVGLYWRRTFFQRAVPQIAAAGPAPAGRMGGLVADVVPGMPMGEARRRLREAGYGNGAPQGRAWLYEADFLPGAAGGLRQRLALVGNGRGRLERAVLLVDLPADPEEALALYRRLAQRLMDRHGRPALHVERGEPGPRWREAVRSGRLARAMEWRTAGGRVLRLGFPAPVGAPVRLELHLARQLPPLEEGRWGLEEVL